MILVSEDSGRSLYFKEKLKRVVVQSPVSELLVSSKCPDEFYFSNGVRNITQEVDIHLER